MTVIKKGKFFLSFLFSPNPFILLSLSTFAVSTFLPQLRNMRTNSLFLSLFFFLYPNLNHELKFVPMLKLIVREIVKASSWLYSLYTYFLLATFCEMVISWKPKLLYLSTEDELLFKFETIDEFG